jgi:Bacterial pre-peptidase C-terminal domain
MKRSSFIGGILAGATTLVLAACGSDPTPSGTGGTSTGGGSSSSTSTSTTGSTVTTSTGASTGTSTGTGGTGGGSGLCANAPVLDLGSSVDGDLAMTGQVDYYRISGKKGWAIQLDIDAQYLGSADYDPTYVDSVITVFDEGGVQLAQNNDPLEYSTNDSRLYTILPADGDYCVRVAECWSVVANPGSSCAAPKDKTTTAYKLYAEQLLDDPGEPGTADLEKGDDAASATAVDYVKTLSGYLTTSIWGSFKDQDDVDVFSFTPPANFGGVPANVRTNVGVRIMPSGPSQSGATTPTGKVTIVDASPPGATLAELDGSSNVRLTPPIELGHPYYLFVTRPKGMTGPNDFYFLRYDVGWGNPLEAEKGSGANDTPDKAEAFAGSGSDVYVEGDLSSAPQDVDHFLATVPAGVTQVNVGCSAQRYGSGLRGMKISLLTAAGAPLANNATDTETETHFVGLSKVALGAAAKIVLKVEAASQAPAITSAFYWCGVHFKP